MRQTSAEPDRDTRDGVTAILCENLHEGAVADVRIGRVYLASPLLVRAHFAAIGHPLTGDTTYGGARRYGLERQFLHAYSLSFDHPITGVRVKAASPLPDDLEQALEQARG